MTVTISACCISHDWKEATCTEPKTCTKCNKTEGEALGHDWAEATCTEPKTCSICGETEGKAIGHIAQEASCTEDAICSVCGEVAEKATGHYWKAATIEKPMTCIVCGLTEGEPKEVSYFDISFAEFMNQFNKAFTGAAKIVHQSTLGGYKIESKPISFHVFGNKYYIFNADESNEGWGMTLCDESLEKFNLLMFRYVSEYGNTEVDDAGLLFGLYIPSMAANILDKNLPEDFVKQLLNGKAIDVDSEFKYTYTNSGYLYTFESYFSSATDVQRRTFDFTISLAANH